MPLTPTLTPAQFEIAFRCDGELRFFRGTLAPDRKATLAELAFSAIHAVAKNEIPDSPIATEITLTIRSR